MKETKTTIKPRLDDPVSPDAEITLDIIIPPEITNWNTDYSWSNPGDAHEYRLQRKLK